ncbi:MAG: glycosyltransferase [Candidatus Levybacteria bacterium CG10_big_fil_rev_8_21_14_0_10_35_13]|nr:MAG: glycosyltransferase [Candidatus Levybacteria bacterium CG10_big_fil_rev_8_21_14_0_10_35_13]
MISAVTPVFNEEESLEAFFKVLIPNLSKLDREYEVIFVDDGSTDDTLKILKKFEKENKSVKVLSYRKNRGKAEVLTSGFKASKGDLVVTLDADLQDRPEEIGRLIEKQKQGFDMVSGWRKDRKDALKTRISSKFFNFIMSSFWGVHLHDYNCGLKLYTKEVAHGLNLYGGMYRFIPLLVSEKGFNVTEVAVVHEKRKFGKSKYGFSKIFKDIPDMFTILFLTRYAKRPLHFFGTVGAILGAIGFIVLLYLSILHFMGEAIGTRPLLIFGMLLVLTGFQLLFTGFLADLILHISEKHNDNESDEDDLRYKTE